MGGLIYLSTDALHSDPDLIVGGHVCIERSDGRSVWRQRLIVVAKFSTGYLLKGTTPGGEDLP